MTEAIDVLARTLYGEARNQGREGIQAVANVVLNRVAAARAGTTKWWGTDIISVCRKPYQFSCWNTTDPNCKIIKEVGTESVIFKLCVDIATHAVNNKLPDITKGATHYYAKSMKSPPPWSRNRTACAAIRDHIFFNNI